MKCSVSCGEVVELSIICLLFFGHVILTKCMRSCTLRVFKKVSIEFFCALFTNLLLNFQLQLFQVRQAAS